MQLVFPSLTLALLFLWLSALSFWIGLGHHQRRADGQRSRHRILFGGWGSAMRDQQPPEGRPRFRLSINSRGGQRAASRPPSLPFSARSIACSRSAHLMRTSTPGTTVADRAEKIKTLLLCFSLVR